MRTSQCRAYLPSRGNTGESRISGELSHNSHCRARHKVTKVIVPSKTTLRAVLGISEPAIVVAQQRPDAVPGAGECAHEKLRTLVSETALGAEFRHLPQNQT